MYYIIYNNRLTGNSVLYIYIYYVQPRTGASYDVQPPNIFCLYKRGIARVTQGCNSFHDIVILYDMTKNGIIFLSPIRRRLKINVKQKYNTSDWFYTTYTAHTTQRLTICIYIYTHKLYSARSPAFVLNIIMMTHPLL